MGECENVGKWDTKEFHTNSKEEGKSQRRKRNHKEKGKKETKKEEKKERDIQRSNKPNEIEHCMINHQTDTQTQKQTQIQTEDTSTRVLSPHAMTMLKQKFTERQNFETDCEPFLNSNIKKKHLQEFTFYLHADTHYRQTDIYTNILQTCSLSLAWHDWN